MKIDLNKIDKSKFQIKEKDGLFLVNPINNPKWTKYELIFRSSIWNEDGELVSAGFKKFFNWEENNELSNWNNDITGCEFIEKLDGSLLICSWYKGNFIYRTRGTFDVYQFDNSSEVTQLREKYNIDSVLDITVRDKGTLLFEWTTPSNKIVLNYDKPDLTLVGYIFHDDYTYADQETLDNIAKLFKWNRPGRYDFNKIDNLKCVKDWIDVEGICMYYNDGQSILKIKSFDYLKKHSFKSNLNWERLVNMYWDWKESFEYDSDMFFKHISDLYDFELRKYVEDLYEKKLLKVNGEYNWSASIAYDFFEKNKYLTRKDYALKLQEQFNQKPFVRTLAFKYLDGKLPDSKTIRNFYINYYN